MVNTTVWDTANAWLTRAWAPTLPVILITALVTVTLPILLHYFLYRTRAAVTIPTFLLLGPSGAGKTALLTALESGTASATHTSQTTFSVDTTLPADRSPASSGFRASSDPSRATSRRLRVIDTPGHGKLRKPTLDALSGRATAGSAPGTHSAKTLQHTKHIIFVLDSASMSLGGGGGGAGHTALSDAAEYLYDVLLVLQQRGTACNLVIAVNKMDLFTALPPSLVSKELEGEITRLRRTRSAALLDSSVGQSGDADDAQSHWLGVSGRAPFTFSQLAEAGVHVDVLAASVVGAEGPGLGPLWDWIARLM